jgi:hypothetical protein
MTRPGRKYTDENLRRIAEELCQLRHFIAAGWVSKVASTAPSDVTDRELYASFTSFFVGVEHVFGMLDGLDEAGLGEVATTAMVALMRLELEHHNKTDGPPPTVQHPLDPPPGSKPH